MSKDALRFEGGWIPLILGLRNKGPQQQFIKNTCDKLF